MRVPALICALLCMVPVAAHAAREKHLVRAAAKVIGLDGHEMGAAKFAQSSHGVLIEIEVHGLTPGAHAIHIHSAGVCDPKRKFENAGPDFSPTPKLHGFFGKGGPHAGDLPNEYAGADGTLHAAILASAISLGKGKKTLFDKDGASIIIHANGDDYTNQPAGNSGARVACGVIRKL
ncbi:MAG TPA: superoxide dismutase family protein [Rhizomicrobium sp.]|nr:superoxide dismutase family protein [Rhizomicrobium sp.]